MEKNLLDFKIYAEQVRLLYKDVKTSVAANCIAALLLVYSQSGVIEQEILLAWLFSLIFIVLLRSVLAYFYIRKNPTVYESIFWGRAFIAGVFLTGIMWGSGAVIFFPQNDSSHQILIIAVLIGMCAGATTSLAVMRTALLAFLIPTLLPALLLPILEYNTLSPIVFVLVALAFLFFLRGANNIHSNTKENIRLRITAEESEQAHHKNEIFQRTLLDTSPDSIFVLDQSGIIKKANRISELQREKHLLGHKVIDFISDEYRSLFNEAFQLAIESKELQSIEITEEHPQGLRYFLCRLNPVEIADDFIIVLISTDITDRKRIEQDLLKARDEANFANKAKSVFLSNMSHELRTPLNAILGFGQLLETELTTEKQKEYVSKLLNSGEHLLEVINEILDLSKIESGKEELQLQSCSLNSMLDECFHLMEAIATKAGIEIIDNIKNASDYYIHVDVMRFKQVMLNLMSNAIKYNKEHGCVTVSCEVRDEKVLRINVTDTGEGLTVKQQQALYHPFERLHDHEDIEGSGIGLVISKHLIELMGGTTGFESIKGQGSTFWIEVNLSEKVEQEVTLTDTDADTGKTEEKPASAKKILYIDDNLSNLSIVESIIEIKTPYQLLTETDALSGLKLAIKQQPDLILTDINMPEMNGYQLLAELQKNEQLQHIPVMAVSANVMPRDIKRALEAGFHSYISKPFTIDDMVDSINKILE